MRRVLVVGAGIAGTAAALTAARAGARVSMVAAAPGASVLTGGALDASPWESPGAAPALGEDERAVLEALDAFEVGARGALVATLAGIVRPARGADRALLDLAGLEGAVVWVPAFDGRAWDARALAASWTDAAASRARGVTFEASPSELLRETAEREGVDADIAARHDAPERLAWLAARLVEGLRARGAATRAVVLPPWLGVERSRAAALSATVRVPCGEALSGPGGPSGLRFERARDRALAAAGIAVTAGRVVAIAGAGPFHAALATAEALPEVDAVVLATGGLVGGGLAYAPLASKGTPVIGATIDAPLVVGARGAPLLAPSSLFGAPPEASAWPDTDEPLLERAGVLAGDDGAASAAPRGLFAAGDVVADRPRTWLEALARGARAGRAAAEGS